MSGLTNGLLESLNSLIQAAKSRARGYRTTKNLKIMTYIVAGKIGQLPHEIATAQKNLETI